MKIADPNAVIVGVDISKGWLDANLFGEERVTRFANDGKGRAKFLAWLRKLQGRPIVGFEPSGGYERPLIKTLLKAGVEARFADAARVRKLAEAHGAPAKTDPIDARFIARFIAEVGGRIIDLCVDREKLADLLAARRTFVEHAHALSQSASLLDKGEAKAALDKQAATMRREAKALERRALALVKADPELVQIFRRMQTVPGCGPIVAMTLIAEAPELGALNGKQAARLIGLAPFIRKSGAWAGYAKICGGRVAPRKVLYMAAMAAKSADRRFKAFFDRLVAAGKPKMLALTALMRKLVTILNAILRDGTEWEPNKIPARA